MFPLDVSGSTVLLGVQLIRAAKTGIKHKNFMMLRNPRLKRHIGFSGANITI
jgi:hypothetical protein